MFRNAKRFTAILLVLILAASTYAFAAANTTGASNAGFGTKVINGYAVNDIAYISAGADDDISSITFKLSDAVAPLTVSEKPTTVRLSTTAGHATADFANAICSTGQTADGLIGTRGTPWLITCNLTAPVLMTSIVGITIVASSSTNYTQVP